MEQLWESAFKSQEELQKIPRSFSKCRQKNICSENVENTRKNIGIE